MKRKTLSLIIVAFFIAIFNLFPVAANADECAEEPQGTPCSFNAVTGDYEGTCVNKKCVIANGKLGEACGSNKEGTCTKEENTFCPAGKNNILIGNNCSSGLVCCSEVADPDRPADLEVTITKTTCGKSNQEGVSGGFLSFQGSIVPCGRQCDDPGTSLDESKSCTLCHFLIMGQRAYNLVLALLIPVALFFITLGGVMYMLSGPSIVKKGLGKEIISKTLLGFALFMGGWLIVFSLLKALAVNNTLLGNGQKWYEFDCDTTSTFDSYQSQQSGVPTGATEEAPSDSGYTFQSGIDKQWGDASPELKSFLECMKPKLPTGAKELSSISDKVGFTTCKIDHPSSCAHAKNSCHYGGTKCNKSYAADFGNESYAGDIEKAAKECNSKAYTKNAGDHIHVSIGGANGCGCN